MSESSPEYVKRTWSPSCFVNLTHMHTENCSSLAKPVLNFTTASWSMANLSAAHDAWKVRVVQNFISHFWLHNSHEQGTHLIALHFACEGNFDQFYLQTSLCLQIRWTSKLETFARNSHRIHLHQNIHSCWMNWAANPLNHRALWSCWNYSEIPRCLLCREKFGTQKMRRDVRLASTHKLDWSSREQSSEETASLFFYLFLLFLA